MKKKLFILCSSEFGWLIGTIFVHKLLLWWFSRLGAPGMIICKCVITVTFSLFMCSSLARGFSTPVNILLDLNRSNTELMLKKVKKKRLLFSYYMRIPQLNKWKMNWFCLMFYINLCKRNCHRNWTLILRNTNQLTNRLFYRRFDPFVRIFLTQVCVFLKMVESISPQYTIHIFSFRMSPF